jgi:uncharacterized membrane protein YkvI
MANRTQSLSALLLPGFVFLSLITGGGFATGQEVVQYCLSHGRYWLAFVAAVFVGLTILMYLTAETARFFNTYDYRTWARAMLPGRSWIALEVVYAAMTVLVCAIVLSAAAAVLSQVSVLPGLAGILLAALASVVLTAVGRRAVIATKVIGAALLAGGYIAFAAITWSKIPAHAILGSSGKPGWFGDAMIYIGYNAVAFPAALYTLRDIHSRKQSFIAGLFASAFTMASFVGVALTVIAGGNGALNAEAPLHYALRHLAAPLWLALYYAVFLWTLVDTAVGMVYAIVVRAEAAYRESGGTELRPSYRWLISTGFLGVSAAFAQFGLIPLIVKGYGTMAYFFIGVVVIPLLAFGFGIHRRRAAQTEL